MEKLDSHDDNNHSYILAYESDLLMVSILKKKSVINCLATKLELWKSTFLNTVIFLDRVLQTMEFDQ